MQLRLHNRSKKNWLVNAFVIKAVLFVLIFFLAVFLLDKIEIKAPSKLIKQEIKNDKIITLK